MLPGGVIGNTAEFGSAFPGSSPGWAVLRLPRFARSLSTSGYIKAREEKYPERVRNVGEERVERHHVVCLYPQM